MTEIVAAISPVADTETKKGEDIFIMPRHKDGFSEQNKASCRTSLTPRL